MFSQHT